MSHGQERSRAPLEPALGGASSSIASPAMRHAAAPRQELYAELRDDFYGKLVVVMATIKADGYSAHHQPGPQPVRISMRAGCAGLRGDEAGNSQLKWPCARLFRLHCPAVPAGTGDPAKDWDNSHSSKATLGGDVGGCSGCLGLHCRCARLAGSADTYWGIAALQ